MSPILLPKSCSALAVLDSHKASLNLSFWTFYRIVRLAELGLDRIDRSTMKMKH